MSLDVKEKKKENKFEKKRKLFKKLGLICLAITFSPVVLSMVLNTTPSYSGMLAIGGGVGTAVFGFLWLFASKNKEKYEINFCFCGEPITYNEENFEFSAGPSEKSHRKDSQNGNDIYVTSRALYLTYTCPHCKAWKRFYCGSTCLERTVRAAGVGLEHTPYSFDEAKAEGTAVATFIERNPERIHIRDSSEDE